MAKFYFRGEDAWCYTKEYHMANAREEGLQVIELFEAEVDAVPGYFVCRAVIEVGEDGSCGANCELYAPRNGRSGMCRHRSNKFYEPGEKVTFKVK